MDNIIEKRCFVKIRSVADLRRAKREKKFGTWYHMQSSYCVEDNLDALEGLKKAGGVPRAGDVPEKGPVVVPGVDTIDVTAVNTQMLSLNHSGYAETSALLTDISLLLKTGQRPRERRLPILRRIENGSGSYWRHPG